MGPRRAEWSIMRKILLAILCLVGPLAAANAKVFQGTISPMETVTLTLEDDRKASLSLHEASKDSHTETAICTYAWKENQLDLHVEDIRFQGARSQLREADEGFCVEIRRKGVDGPSPVVWLMRGEDVEFKTRLDGDRLVLSGPDGWELPLVLQP